MVGFVADGVEPFRLHDAADDGVVDPLIGRESPLGVQVGTWLDGLLAIVAGGGAVGFGIGASFSFASASHPSPYENANSLVMEGIILAFIGLACLGLASFFVLLARGNSRGRSWARPGHVFMGGLLAFIATGFALFGLFLAVMGRGEDQVFGILFAVVAIPMAGLCVWLVRYYASDAVQAHFRPQRPSTVWRAEAPTMEPARR